MIKGKEAYLKKLTSSMYLPSLEIGKELDGSTPPSVFIGSWNYPKVYAGPMFAPQHGNTAIMDLPESWIPERKTQEEIIRYRLNLVRGKKTVKVTNLETRFVEKLQDISLASSSIESEAEFGHAPKGMSFSDEHTPFGPSAPLERFNIGNVKWDRDLERVYYDVDLKAADAVAELHKNGTPFSKIQKAFSVGAVGPKKRRRLVPTRWSITACDSALGNRMLREIRNYDIIDCCQVREFESLNNYYAVLLLPTAWQYEWMEAFPAFWEMRSLSSPTTSTILERRGIPALVGATTPAKWRSWRLWLGKRSRLEPSSLEKPIQGTCRWGFLMCGRTSETPWTSLRPNSRILGQLSWKSLQGLSCLSRDSSSKVTFSKNRSWVGRRP